MQHAATGCPCPRSIRRKSAAQMQQRALVFLRTACNVNSISRTTSFALSTIVSPLLTRMATRPRSPSPGLVSAKHARLSSSTTKSVNTQSSPSSSSNKIKNDENMTVETAQEPFLFVELDANHPNAKEPTRGSALAAGYDLYASEACVIPKAGGRKIVPTGIRLAIPQQCYGRVAPRSGLASKHGIDVGAGVIDADYRGLLGVLLYNFGSEDFHVNVGDRIAQLVLERIMTPKVKTVKTLDETVRGAAGFGSTGGFGAAPPASATTTTNGISEDKSSS